MANVEFTIKYEDSEKIRQTILDYQNNAEDVINDYLKNEAGEKFINSITNLIPVSERNKKHARDSEPLESSLIANLTLKINTKSPYYYLYFPQTGAGTSRGKEANDFMEKGIDRVYDNVINELLDRLGGI